MELQIREERGMTKKSDGKVVSQDTEQIQILTPLGS